MGVVQGSSRQTKEMVIVLLERKNMTADVISTWGLREGYHEENNKDRDQMCLTEQKDVIGVQHKGSPHRGCAMTIKRQQHRS